MRQAKMWGGPEYGGPDVPTGTDLFAKRDEELTEEEKQTLQAVTEWSLDLGNWLKGARLSKYCAEIFQKAEVAKEDPQGDCAILGSLV